MDDFKEGFAAGWAEAIAEAERRCENVWWPTGGAGVAVPWTELVHVRKLVELAGRARDGQGG